MTDSANIPALELEPYLAPLRERLLGPGDGRSNGDAFDVTVREKGNGILSVAVRARPNGDQPPFTPTTATFELTPHVEGGHVTYQSTEPDFSLSAQ